MYLLLKKILPDFIKKAIKNVVFFIASYGYKREIEKRTKYSVFDYQQLAADMPLVTREYGYNAFYGIANIIKEQLDLPQGQPFEGIIEHGFCLPPDDVSEIDHPLQTVFVMGEVRQRYLQQRFPEKKIYSIGPYIQYVRSFHSDSWITEERNRLGKTLLVFPSHSTHHATMTFDIDGFFSEVERVRVEYHFSTVLVCLYWKDILLHLDRDILSRGYQIVTAGHIYDPNFLLRLRSIFLLADVAMGNSIGTHIGYSIACDIPYYFYDCPAEYTGDSVNYSDENILILKELFRKFLGDYRESIIPEARNFIEEYWGRWPTEIMR